MNVKERLKKFIKSEFLTIVEFEQSIGVSNGYVNSISKNIGIDKLNTIIERYPNLNIEWLLAGKGDMTKQSSPMHQDYGLKRIDELNEIIDIQRKLINNLEAEVKRLEKELEKNQNFSSSHMAADEELNYTKKKR